MEEVVEKTTETVEEKEIPLEELEKKIDYSYSRVGLYTQCGFKYKLKYIDKNYDYSGNIATSFGSAMHSAEEAIANSIIAKEPINYVAIKNKFIIELARIRSKFPNEFGKYIESINGEYENVVGLPIEEIKKKLNLIKR